MKLVAADRHHIDLHFDRISDDAGKAGKEIGVVLSIAEGVALGFAEMEVKPTANKIGTLSDRHSLLLQTNSPFIFKMKKIYVRPTLNSWLALRI